MTDKHQLLTQQFSTFGDKLLQHCDVLSSIQNDGVFRPITVQLAITEVCDSDCHFCSVAERPLKSYMPLKEIEQVLYDFRALGAKSVEITGGGNPLLYRDKETGRTINDVIRTAALFGLAVGIITNSHDLKAIDSSVYGMISWIRISLIKLDEGKEPEDYNFRGFPITKLGFSYIIYTADTPTPRTQKTVSGTTIETIRRIAQLVELHPEVKFVRIAGNCLIKGNNQVVKDEWRDIIDEIDKHGKFFVKDIGENDSPFNDACYVGAVRPYVAPSPNGDGYKVYICTSHVLQKRTYDLDYALCGTSDILPTWRRMNKSFKETGHPYSVKGNDGGGWCKTCQFCYYGNNNKLLHTVATSMPDGEFA